VFGLFDVVALGVLTDAVHFRHSSEAKGTFRLLREKVRVTRCGTTRTSVVGRARVMEAAVGGWPSATDERLPSLAE